MKQQNTTYSISLSFVESLGIKLFTLATLFLTININTTKAQYFIHEPNFDITPFGSPSLDHFNVVNDTLISLGWPWITPNQDTVRAIAKWDGNNYHPMGLGNTNTNGAFSTSLYRDTLYIVGGFFSYGGKNAVFITRWDGYDYYKVLDLDYHGGNFFTSTVYHDTLFVGGENNGVITGIDTSYYYGIMGYRNGKAINVGSLFNVNSLEVYNDELYACGISSVLVKYKGGTQWEQVGGYMNYYAWDMEVDTINNFLYITGGFYAVDDTVLITGAAIWNGFYWESMAPFDTNMLVDGRSIAFYHGDVYIGGVWWDPHIQYPNNSSITGLMRWDGQSWTMLDNKVINGDITALQVYKDELYIGGDFTKIGNDTVYGIARWYYPPDTTCKYLKPRVFSLADTFYLDSGLVNVQFYNNNAYVDTWDWDFGDLGTSNIKDPMHTYSDTGSFVVSVTVNDTGCIKTAQKNIVIIEPSSAITKNNFSNVYFIVYPNPTKTFFTADVNIPECYINQKININIYNLNGTLKDKYNISYDTKTFAIPTTNWESGSYICTLTIGNKLVRKKILVYNK